MMKPPAPARSSSPFDSPKIQSVIDLNKSDVLSLRSKLGDLPNQRLNGSIAPSKLGGRAYDKRSMYRRQGQGSGDRFMVAGTRNNGPSEEDVRKFARHCKQFYFSTEPSTESSTYISSTLTSSPANHRPVYNRIQASLRSLAHIHHLRLRISSFHALISALQPSASLSIASRGKLNSDLAIRERKRSVEGFGRKWFNIGTEPFFRGLYAVLRLQSRGGKDRGGAGERCLVWELDDAVFQESGGPEFMHDAVEILKGVLGFTDQALSTAPKLRRIPTLPKSFTWKQPPLLSNNRRLSPESQKQEVVEIAEDTTSHFNRSRAISDPFTDSHNPSSIPVQPANQARPALPARRSSSDVSSPLQESKPLLQTRQSLTGSVVSGIGTGGEGEDELEDWDEDELADEESELNKPRFRLWTFPTHINDQEIDGLLRVMPVKVGVGKAKDVRLPYLRPGHGIKDLESGEVNGWKSVSVGGAVVASVPELENEVLEGVVRAGTGRTWAGLNTRNTGWAGSGWFKFKRWWRRLFGMD